jgi:hypothetical protein
MLFRSETRVYTGDLQHNSRVGLCSTGWRFECGAGSTRQFVDGWFGVKCGRFDRNIQVSNPAHHLHEPGRTAARFGTGKALVLRFGRLTAVSPRNETHDA